MKAKITGVRFVKEFDGKYGKAFVFGVSYNGKEAQYISKSKDQDKFVKGQDAEFTETVKTWNNEEQITIRPVQANTGNFGRALKKEQSRYSTMGASYVKDLIIAGKVDIVDWERATDKIVKFMLNLDKSIES